MGMRAHLIIKEYGDDFDNIKLVRSKKEKHISHSKMMNNESE